jgi:hypothetical protein
VVVLTVIVTCILMLTAACGGSSPEPTATPSPTATATITPTPSPTSTPSPTATPSPTPSPTPFIPPTVAVTDSDSIQSCLERNLTPELLVSLSQDDTSLTKDIMRTCLETTIPSQLVFLMGPIIDDASQCALDVSKTLSNDDLFALAGNDQTRKDAIINDVSNKIVSCVASKYGLDFLT